MADCLPSARTCSLLSVIAPQTLFWTVHSKVSVHKWLRKRSRPSDGQPSHNPGKGKVCRQSAQDSASRFHQVSQLAGSQKIFAPRWSPDGRYIVAIAMGNNKLVLYDLKNKTWRQLEPNLTFGYLAWSHDSAYVYFDTFLSKNRGYFRLRISDSKIEKVADLKNARLYRGQFGLGSWTGLGPGDIPLFPVAANGFQQRTRSLEVDFRPGITMRLAL
jgi:hypothetical protein